MLHLAEEKELTRRSDELARKRQALPWVAVEREYPFETEDGRGHGRRPRAGRAGTTNTNE